MNSTQWRYVDVLLPTGANRFDVETVLGAEILRTASGNGEFASEIRIEGILERSETWNKWRVGYLPGPPGVLGGALTPGLAIGTRKPRRSRVGRKAHDECCRQANPKGMVTQMVSPKV